MLSDRRYNREVGNREIIGKPYRHMDSNYKHAQPHVWSPCASMRNVFSNHFEHAL